MKKYKRLFIVLLTIFVVTIFITAINHSKTKQIDLGSMLYFNMVWDNDRETPALNINIDFDKMRNYLEEELETNEEGILQMSKDIEEVGGKSLFDIDFILPGKMILTEATKTKIATYNLDEIEKANGMIPLKIEYGEDSYKKLGYSLPKKINVKLNMEKFEDLILKEEKDLYYLDKTEIDFEYYY